MARRSDHSREDLKTLAITAGIAQIEQRGFAKFSARGVAASMGYTVGTLYHLYGSLDEFLLHLNAQTLEEWYAAMQPHQGDVTQLAYAYLRFARQHPQRFHALFEHRLEADRPLPAWYQQKMQALFALVEASLPAHPNTPHLARTLWAGIHGICILSPSHKLEAAGADTAEALAETLISAVLHHKE